jgi:hypothetical protein
MLRGDAARFYFYIQAVGTTVKQSCSYYVSGMEPLIVTFDKEKVVIDPEAEEKIYGTISIPNDAPIKTYNGKLIASCEPHLEESESGGSLIKQRMGVDFIVDVVERPEERVVREVPEEEKPKVSNLSLVLLIIVLILSIIGFYLTRKKEKSKVQG